MKKKFGFIGSLGISLLLSTMVACSNDDSKESCDKFDENVGTCSADQITACCDDGGSCYYLYQGDKYNNVTDLATVCTSGSTMELQEISLQLDAFTTRLIDEARTAALCQ